MFTFEGVLTRNENNPRDVILFFFFFFQTRLYESRNESTIVIDSGFGDTRRYTIITVKGIGARTSWTDRNFV